MELEAEYFCAICQKTLATANFSGNQLRREREHKRKCKGCVSVNNDKELAEREVSKMQKKERKRLLTTWGAVKAPVRGQEEPEEDGHPEPAEQRRQSPRPARRRDSATGASKVDT